MSGWGAYTPECMRMHSRFVGYRFSGSLRPWPITPQVSVPPTIPAPDYAESGVPISEQSLRHNAIKIHTQEEIEVYIILIILLLYI